MHRGKLKTSAAAYVAWHFAGHIFRRKKFTALERKKLQLFISAHGIFMPFVCVDIFWAIQELFHKMMHCCVSCLCFPGKMMMMKEFSNFLKVSSSKEVSVLCSASIPLLLTVRA